MKTCAICSELLEDTVMECPKCQHSRFIQSRTKAPLEKKEEFVALPPRTLSDMHLAILESLLDQPDFVNAPQFIKSLQLPNESLARLAVMSIQDMVNSGLIEVKGRSQIRITPLGRETYAREKDLPGPEQ